MLETILYAIGFFIFTIFLQWLLHKVRKNHNQGNSATWVGNGAIIVICVMGLMTKNINYFSALLGFVVGDEVGKQAGWQQRHIKKKQVCDRKRRCIMILDEKVQEKLEKTTNMLNMINKIELYF